MSAAPGVHPSPTGTRFTVRAPLASAVELCLFEGDAERRLPMARDGDCWTAELPGAWAGQRYGYRAHGVHDPARGLLFDPAKLLVDPYAVELDRPFAYDPRLAAFGEDTAALVPRAVVPAPVIRPAPEPPLFRPGRLVYEANVRCLTMRHPDVPEHLRGTMGALAHPAVIAHMAKLRVAAVELMPVTAWIDERHLPPLGLSNAWGYNPVVPMALDPRLVPGGVAEFAATVAALRDAGIGTILDLVFNHTGESDAAGPTLSFRGLDPSAYATDHGRLINDTGCGNTLDFGRHQVRELALATLRHFATLGVDGFRFDLAPVMARSPGFDAGAAIFGAIAADPLLSTRVMIAEPWDCGPGGYRLGEFPAGWSEWNDRYRDDVRRFWRGDGSAGVLATRMAGSSDVFAGPATRSVNFVAAHDGFTLADTVSHAGRHNWANGEDNRDGHAHEVAWNNGHEGATGDPGILAARAADARALLGTLFASLGTPMLAAGDEFGRTQRGNNNAYAQNNELGWLDWDARDAALEDHVAGLAAARAGSALEDPDFLRDADWRALDGRPMTPDLWAEADGFVLNLSDVSVRVDRAARTVRITRLD